MSRVVTAGKRLVAGVVFVGILAVSLWSLGFTLDPGRDEPTLWDSYYLRDRDSIDVLFVGNSHVQCTVAPMQLWSEHGVTSWGITSPAANWQIKAAYLEEALKTQSPQLVAVEAYSVGAATELSGPAAQIAVEKIPLSVTSLRAALETAPAHTIERLWIPFVRNHSNYTRFSDAMLRPGKHITVRTADASHAGALILSLPREELDGDAAEGVVPLGTQSEADVQANMQSIRRIVELCADRNIPLLIWLAPIQGETDQEHLFAVLKLELAAEYPEVRFLNLNEHVGSIGLELTDYRDRGHLYAWGQERVTSWLGDRLVASGMVVPQDRVIEASWWNRSAAQWALDVDTAVRDSPVVR